MFTFRRSIFIFVTTFSIVLTSSLSLRLIRAPAEDSSTSSAAKSGNTSSSIDCGARRDKTDASHAGSPDEYSEFGEFPWTVAILQTSSAPNEDGTHSLGYICSGSLLSPTVVMTAAHCVFNVDRTTLRIRAGVHDINSDPNDKLPHQERTANQVSIHSNYNRKLLENDVALVKVDQAFHYDQHISPICVPFDRSLRATPDWYNRQDCVVSGWGKNSRDDKSAFPQKLKKVHVEVLPDDQCESRLKSTRLGANFKLHPSSMCALEKNPTNNVCEGYGGAPLACSLKSNPETMVQVGVTSWGVGCNSYIPGIYASMSSANVDWLFKEVTSMSGLA